MRAGDPKHQKEVISETVLTPLLGPSSFFSNNLIVSTISLLTFPIYCSVVVTFWCRNILWMALALALCVSASTEAAYLAVFIIDFRVLIFDINGHIRAEFPADAALDAVFKVNFRPDIPPDTCFVIEH